MSESDHWPEIAESRPRKSVLTEPSFSSYLGDGGKRWSSASEPCWRGSWRTKGAVRQLLAQDVSFDALCNEYGKVIKLLDAFEAHVKLLRARRAWLEEELLTRIEGHQPY